MAKIEATKIANIKRINENRDKAIAEIKEKYALRIRIIKLVKIAVITLICCLICFMVIMDLIKFWNFIKRIAKRKRELNKLKKLKEKRLRSYELNEIKIKEQRKYREMHKQEVDDIIFKTRDSLIKSILNKRIKNMNKTIIKRQRLTRMNNMETIKE